MTHLSERTADVWQECWRSGQDPADRFGRAFGAWGAYGLWLMDLDRRGAFGDRPIEQLPDLFPCGDQHLPRIQILIYGNIGAIFGQVAPHLHIHIR